MKARRLEAKTLSCLFCFFAASASPHVACAQVGAGAGASSPRKTHLGAQAGLLFYGSPFLGLMNQRLGNSLALPVEAELGRTRAFAGSWRKSLNETWHWGAEATHGSENIAAEGTGNSPASVKASTSFQSLSLWGALRFAPVPRFSTSGFSPYLGLIGFRPLSGGTNTIKGFYALLLAKGGIGRFAHAFDLRIPRDETAVAYSGWALNAHYGGGLRAAYRLGQWADAELETCYVGTLPLYARTQVEAFEVEGQNLGTRRNELQVTEITRAHWQMVTVKAGLSVFF